MQDATLLAKARQGDARSLDLLFLPIRPVLFALCYRMLCHRADAEDATQEALLRAYRALDRFRGDSKLQTWTLSIGTRVCLDLLRRRARYPIDAQIDGERYSKARPDELGPIESAIGRPDFRYDFREHMAFCFSCVARSLPMEQQAAIILRDVFGLANREAARALDVTESVLRHALSAGREALRRRYDGLCALVGKQGVCYQCDVLREASPTDRRGPAVQPLPGDREAQYRARVAAVRAADLEGGSSAPLHAVLFDLVERRSAERAMR